MNKRDEIGMQRLASVLFPDLAERRKFLAALTDGAPREQAIIVLEDKAEIRAFPKKKPAAWQPDFVLRLPDYFKPGIHPHHQKGAFYVLDLSSVFAASAMLALPSAPKRILDLCAAPGGKSIFAHRAFLPDLLACNETMKRRLPTLTGNLTRCKISESVASCTDPSVWAKKAPVQFDLVIVDAPCSGQSLLAKGDDAPDCWNPEMIDTCVGRQRRIVGNAIRCLRPGGALLYMTCTFTRKENERIIEWVLAANPDLSAVPIPHLAEFQSSHSQVPCYRLYPHQGFGAGAFTALLLRDATETPPPEVKLDELPVSWRYGMTEFAPRSPESATTPRRRPSKRPRP